MLLHSISGSRINSTTGSILLHFAFRLAISLLVSTFLFTAWMNDHSFSSLHLPVSFRPNRPRRLSLQHSFRFASPDSANWHVLPFHGLFLSNCEGKKDVVSPSFTGYFLDTSSTTARHDGTHINQHIIFPLLAPASSFPLSMMHTQNDDDGWRWPTFFFPFAFSSGSTLIMEWYMTCVCIYVYFFFSFLLSSLFFSFLFNSSWCLVCSLSLSSSSLCYFIMRAMYLLQSQSMSSIDVKSLFQDQTPISQSLVSYIFDIPEHHVGISYCDVGKS